MVNVKFLLWAFLFLPIIISEAADTSSICRSDTCKMTAKIFKSYMDPSFKPCDDFYNFACGSFIKRTPLPVNKHIVGPFTDAHEIQQATLKEILEKYSTVPSTSAQGKAARIYKSCKDSVLTLNQRTANLNALKDLLKDFLNGWPLTTRTWNSRSFDITTTLAKIASQLDQSFFISPMIFPDLENSTKYSLMLMPQQPSQGSFPFVDNVIRSPDQWRQVNSTVWPSQYYSQYAQPDLVGVIREVACIIDPYCATNPNLYNDVMTLNNMLTQGGGYSLNNPELYDIKKWNFMKKNLYSNYEDPEIADLRFTVRRLNAEFPMINWSRYFTILFQNTDFRVDSSFSMIVASEQLQHMINAFQQLTTRELGLFFGWHIVAKWGPLFSPQLRALLTPEQDQTDVCLNMVNNMMGYAVGQLYNSRYVPESSLTELKGIVKDLKVGFRKILEENTWMDGVTKRQALRKMDNMAESLAAPDWIHDTTALDKYYSKMAMTDVLDFRTALRKGKILHFAKQVERLKRLVDRKNDWPIETPAMTNAMYFMPTNSMYFGSGIFQFPFYEAGRPRAVNFGSFGYVAGHEITHGFDTSGATRNHHGELENWWDESSEGEFMERAQCFIDQYGEIQEPMTGLVLNSRLTVGEDIADNGGIRAAFKAYKNGSSSVGSRLEGLEQYTDDQLFFMSAALTYCSKYSSQLMQMSIFTDEHSPNMYRAILPLMNSGDFAEAFNCPLNSKMNPRDKCRVW